MWWQKCRQWPWQIPKNLRLRCSSHFSLIILQQQGLNHLFAQLCLTAALTSLLYVFSWMNEWKNIGNNVQWLTKRNWLIRRILIVIKWPPQSKSRALPIDFNPNRFKLQGKKSATGRKSFQLSEILDELVGVSRSSRQWNKIHNFLSHLNDVQVLMTTRSDNKNGNRQQLKTKSHLHQLRSALCFRLKNSFEGVAKWWWTSGLNVDGHGAQLFINKNGLRSVTLSLHWFGVECGKMCHYHVRYDKRP